MALHSQLPVRLDFVCDQNNLALDSEKSHMEQQQIAENN
jgi:hypothetical protein